MDAKPFFIFSVLMLAAGQLPVVQAEIIESDECTAAAPANCLNGVGPAVTNPDSIRVSSSQISRETGRRGNEDKEYVSLTGQSAAIGRAAGNVLAGWGLWASYSRADFEADLPINSAVQPVASYDAVQHSVLLGADRLFNRWVLGLALGYEDSDIDTAYNGGNNETEGFTVAPYAAWLINDILSIDATAGYTSLSYDTSRIDNVSGGQITADFDADRWFAAANLNAAMQRDRWLLGSRIGLLYTEETQDAYAETGPNTARIISERQLDLVQFIAGIDAAYSFGRIEPYASLYYLNDLSREDGVGAGGLPGNVGATQPDDDDEFQAGVGFRYFGELVTASLEYNETFSRAKFDGNSVFLTVRIDL
ncbi:MAG: autotransporter outer membrane beta-barrel domain-containing protein [Gammaproteobacteria bacterium]|nr:autotransporter outer membrane beta-barrel domain-containing protein [Gammaproteobacteria bacterium]